MIPLAVLAAALLAAVTAVFSGHIPGLRVLVGARTVGPVPPPSGLDEPLPQVLAEHAVTDGPTR